MRQIARALLAQRAALLLPLPDGTARFSVTPSFNEESDLTIADDPYPLVTLRIEPGPSDVTAMVPVRVYETVQVLADESSLKVLDEVTEKLVEGIKGKPFFGFDATIHRAAWAGTKYPAPTATGPANERRSVTAWDLLVSWRAR
jgi:hypothetical protein